MKTNLAKKLIRIVEVYLLEFCEVNNIQEINLKDHIAIFGDRKKKSLAVIDNQECIKFGVRINSENHFEVFGEFSTHQDKFPKTLEVINCMSA